MTQTPASKTTATAGSHKSGGCGCGCGCQDGAKHDPQCCRLTCFERPRYFCGHLLSDADLTAEQSWVREKNKLYHRAIDGDGVVCGLRLRCDPRCDGHIQVGDGFAIDCCGNDLVVCEPRTWDVMGELRAKKWVVDPPKDPCDKSKEPGDDCAGKQCFYIGICYQEQEAEYVTPLQTDCGTGPGPCQATRIREGVRFEVFDELPVRPNALDGIEKRIEQCFRIFREGQFSKGLAHYAPSILAMLDGQQDPAGGNQTPQDVFCRVRNLFLHQLRVCPDQSNCTAEQEVWNIVFPKDVAEATPAVGAAFKSLFELIERYVFSCVLAELAFPCPERAEPCCVLIGSVEVEHGRLTRVLNYPRWYLWCFANWMEVLVYTLANEAACGGHRSGRYQSNELEASYQRHKDGCCPPVEVDVKEFLTLFLARNQAAEFAARAPVEAMRAVRSAFVGGFDFMKPHGVSPQALRNMPVADAQRIADVFNFKLESVGAPIPEQPDFFTALLSHLIHRSGEPLAIFEGTHNNVPVVAGASRILDAPVRQPASTQDTEKLVSDLEHRISLLEADVKVLRETPHAPPGGPQ